MIPSSPLAGREPTGVLSGTRVLDFGQFYAGPFGMRLLADLGADVIKIENINGDPLRALDRVFSAAQRGKRTIAVDLKSEDGNVVVNKLLTTADVVCHNLRPGVADRIGIGYESAKKLNDSIVYVYCPGWGSSGPDAQRQGFAYMFLGLVGLQLEVAGDGNPPSLPVANEDSAGGLLAAAAAVMGLLSRARTGRGQYIESPQLNAAMFMAMHMFRDSAGRVVGKRGMDSDQTGTCSLNRLYRTNDGWICLVVATDHELERLVAVVKDPRLSRAGEDKPNNTEILEPWFASKTTDSCVELLSAAGVPCAVPVVDGGYQTLNQEHYLKIGRIAQYRHPTFGEVREPGQMIRFERAMSDNGTPAPLFGQHSIEILRELGFDDSSIDSMLASRAVR